jgi:HEAT repeat protein
MTYRAQTVAFAALVATLLLSLTVACSAPTSRAQPPPGYPLARAFEWDGSYENRVGEPFDTTVAEFAEAPVSELLRQLSDGSDDERSFAAMAVTQVWFGLSSFGRLSGLWGAMSRDIRVEEIRTARAGKVSARARALVPALVEAMADPCAAVRKNAARSLMMIGPQACSAQPVLRQHLQDEDEWVRAWSARAIYFVSMDIAGAIDASTGLMRSRSADVRTMAAYNMDLMGTDASASEPFLVELTTDSSASVQGQARQALLSVRGQRRNPDGRR